MRFPIGSLLVLAAACASAGNDAVDVESTRGLEAARALVDAGELRPGIAALEAVLANERSDEDTRTEARRWLGHAFTRLGDPETALEDDAAHVKALQWRGYVHALLERHGQAAEDYGRAIELLEGTRLEQLAAWGAERNQLLHWTHVELGKSLDALGRRDEAEKERERADAPLR